MYGAKSKANQFKSFALVDSEMFKRRETFDTQKISIDEYRGRYCNVCLHTLRTLSKSEPMLLKQ